MRIVIEHPEGIHNSVWNYKYLIELGNLASSDYTEQIVPAEYKNEIWRNRFLNNILERIGQFIRSSKAANLMY